MFGAPPPASRRPYHPARVDVSGVHPREGARAAAAGVVWHPERRRMPAYYLATGATRGKLQYAPVVFQVALTAEFGAPDEVRDELRLRLHELASTLASIPAHHHSVWSSLVYSEMRLDVGGWQFLYRVDPSARRITVLRGVPSST